MSKQFEFVKAPQRSPEWFALRKGGITATDAAVIARLSPYKTPYQLAAEKRGLIGEAPAGDAARRGIILEDAVARYAEEEIGKKLKKSNGIVRLKGDRSWAMASLDRTIVGSDEIVEIKTSASPLWHLGTPEFVKAQITWQMLITGAPACYVAALLGGLIFRIERIEYDPLYGAQLFHKAEAWRERYILGDEMPPVDGRDSQAMAIVTPQAVEEVAVAGDGIDRVAALYAEKVAEAKMLDAEVADLAALIKAEIGDKAGIVGSGWSASWRQNKPTRKVNWQLLAAEEKIHADTISAYTEQIAGARVFKFKQEGE